MIDREYVLWGYMTGSGFSGKNGCSTCSEFVIIRSKNASSASLNNSVTDDKSLSAKPIFYINSETSQVRRDLPLNRFQTRLAHSMWPSRRTHPAERLMGCCDFAECAEHTEDWRMTVTDINTWICMTFATQTYDHTAECCSHLSVRCWYSVFCGTGNGTPWYMFHVFLMALNDSWKRFFSAVVSVTSALAVF